MLRSMRRNTKIIMLVVAVAFVGLMVFLFGVVIFFSPLGIGK